MIDLTEGWLQVLLGVFIVHLLVFARRTWQRRQFADAITSVTFFLLVLSFSMRLWLPTWMIYDIPVFAIVRRLAWVTAAWSVLLWIRRRRHARVGTGQQGHGQSDAIDEEVGSRQQQETTHTR